MQLTFIALFFFSVTALHAGVIGRVVDYTSDSLTMKGYLAYKDNATGRMPGVLVVHEWWGLNDYARKRADMLAELGYVAFAVDMYGNGKQANHPNDAGKFAGEATKSLPVMKNRFMAALKILQSNKHVDSTRIAAIGYCFGGGVVLAMAREGIDLKAVASFHGSLSTESPAQHGAVKAKILVCTGGADKFIPTEVVETFKKEMADAGVDCKVISYPEAMHGFTNPAATEMGKKFSIPIKYNTNADKKSWAEMQKLFLRVFQK